MGEFDHSGLQGIILGLFYSRRREWGIHVFPELRVQVSRTRFRVPDITVTTSKAPGGVLRVPPFLCIEVLSPEDRVSRMEVKIDDYLEFGVRHIWLIDPIRRRAWSYTREGKRESTEVLTTSDPDLIISLKDLFEALSEDVE